MINKNIVRDKKNIDKNEQLMNLSYVMQFLIFKKFLLLLKVKLVIFIIKENLQYIIVQYLIQIKNWIIAMCGMSPKQNEVRIK